MKDEGATKTTYNWTIANCGLVGPLSLRERVRVRAVGRRNTLPCLCDFPVPSPPAPLPEGEARSVRKTSILEFVRMGWSRKAPPRFSKDYNGGAR